MGPLGVGLQPQRLDPVDQVVDPRSEPLVARRGRTTWRWAGHDRLVPPCASSARRPADPARPGSALRGRLPALGPTITVAAPPSNPILASTIRW